MERAKDAGLLGVIARSGAILCMLAIFASAPPAQEASAPGEELALKLRAHVVRITAKWRDGTEQNGFGFIVGERDADLYIVTADHVVRGGRPDELAETIAITFFSHQGQEFRAQLLGTHDAGRDIAVLLGERPAGFQLDPEVLRRSSEDLPKRGTRVWYVGRSGRWYVPSAPGTVNSVDLDERIWIDGLNVLVGTSGAPLVASDGIAGMIVADDAGGVSRAIGIGFIERAFGHWAHPWQLREQEAVAGAPADATAPGPVAAAPRQVPPAPATTAPRPAVPPRSPAEASGSREEQGARGPDAAFNPGDVQAAIEAELAHYEPSALPAGPAENPPGILAPTLAISDPEVRIVGGQKLEVTGYVSLEDIDLGHVSAIATPRDQGRFDVAVEFDGVRTGAADCAIDFQQRAFDLAWNGAIAAFTGLRGAFSPIAVKCPGLSLEASDFEIDSSMAEGEDGLWSGELELALKGLWITGDAGGDFLRTDAAELRLTFRGIDFGARDRLLSALPAHYWPRRVALLGMPFDLAAAERGAVPASPAELYAGDASNSDLMAGLSGLKAFFNDGPERIELELADGRIEFRSTPEGALSYRHDGLSINGAGVGIPNALAFELRLGQADARSIAGALSTAQPEQGLLSLLEKTGPLAWEMAGATSGSAANGAGTVWVKPGAQAPSAGAVVRSPDPTTFLLETVLSGLAQEANPAALSRALEETVGAVGRVVTVGGGTQYQFEVEADFETERVVINGIAADDVSLFFNDACAKYGC